MLDAPSDGLVRVALVGRAGTERSHGTWARHEICGKVQKLTPGRGRNECRNCPPDPSSRTHRARAGDRHLLYLVRLGRMQKFGHGDEARVRAHLRAGAEVVQVIEATHAEVSLQSWC